MIKETKDGTAIKTSEILNGIPVIPKLLSSKVEYIVLDESYIDKDIIIESLKIIEAIISCKDVENNILKSKELLGENTSFLFKKTIYKVKKGDT